MNSHELNSLATTAVARLERLNLKLVLAESCTGGLVAAALTTVPGVSKFFCGSTVTYRESTKSQWLGVDATMIEKFSAESAEVTLELAAKVLANTSEADIAIAVTGHLGPNAPDEKDGVVFAAVAGDRFANLPVETTKLNSTGRSQRQTAAAAFVLQTLINHLE